MIYFSEILNICSSRLVSKYVKENDHYTFSVIIVVLNNVSFIRLTVDAIFNTYFPKNDIEIIFIDYSAQPETIDLINEYSKQNQIKISLIHDDIKRNIIDHYLLGVNFASGKIVLFLDDHRIVPKNFFLFHLHHHITSENNIVVGGLHRWIHTHLYSSETIKDRYSLPDSALTDYKFLHNFSHDLMIDLEDYYNTTFPKNKNGIIPWNCFSIGNTSILRQVIKEEALDNSIENIHVAALELGYRLQVKGMNLIYDDKAFALQQNYALNINEYSLNLSLTKLLSKIGNGINKSIPLLIGDQIMIPISRKNYE